MEITARKEEAPRITLLNLLGLALSVYVLGALLVDTVVTLPVQTARLLRFFDDAICGFFLFEFAVRFYQADNKRRFLRWGWIDLLSSIPALPLLRVGRVLRLIRLVRIVRAFRSTRHLIGYIFRSRLQGTVTAVALVAVLVLLFSSIAILQVEIRPDSNIKTAEDALWWAYVTITTVGYGDRYPVTTEGRLIAALLMTVGVGLFSAFTGFLASWFLAGKQKELEQEKLPTPQAEDH